jgi:hypothetical protein
MYWASCHHSTTVIIMIVNSHHLFEYSSLCIRMLIPVKILFICIKYNFFQLFSCWLKTFDDYYVQFVRAIITKAVHYLSSNADLRFIWSEISYLEKWWTENNATQRNNLIRFIYCWCEITNYQTDWYVMDNWRLQAVVGWWPMKQHHISGHQLIIWSKDINFSFKIYK